MKSSPPLDGATEGLPPSAFGEVLHDDSTTSIGAGCEDLSDQRHLAARGAECRPSSEDARNVTIGSVVTANDDELVLRQNLTLDGDERAVTLRQEVELDARQ